MTKPFDCHAALQNWDARWSSKKKAWCCKHEMKGCGDSFCDNLEELHRWTKSKKAFCCRTEGNGCTGSQPLILRPVLATLGDTQRCTQFTPGLDTLCSRSRTNRMFKRSIVPLASIAMTVFPTSFMAGLQPRSIGVAHTRVWLALDLTIQLSL